MPKELKAEFALVCDTGMWDSDTPSICVGAARPGRRGDHDQGRRPRPAFGRVSAVPAANPIRVLAKILAEIHDENGRVTIPGFYDGVEETPSQILKAWEALGETAENFLGADRPVGPVGRKGPFGAGTGLGAADRRVQRHHRRLHRQGLQDGDRGGSVGEGVVPPGAQAGPGQDPRSFPRIRARAHPGRLLGRIRPARRLAGHPAFLRLAVPRQGQGRAFRRMAEAGSDAGRRRLDPDRRRFPETISAWNRCWSASRLSDDRIHSPNEKYDLASFHKGQRSWARILDAHRAR